MLDLLVQADFWSTTVTSPFQVAAEREELSQLFRDESHQQQRQKEPRSLKTPRVHFASPGF